LMHQFLVVLSSNRHIRLFFPDYYCDIVSKTS